MAATGRLSSTDPNLQNIPIRTELGRTIRSAFVAPAGSRARQRRLLADRAPRARAPVAGRGAARRVPHRTGRPHAHRDGDLRGRAEGGVTAEMRRRAKAVNFGVIYGQGDSGLAKSLGIPRTEAASFIAAYFRRYEGVRRFMNADARRGAQPAKPCAACSAAGACCPTSAAATGRERLAAERIAMNMPIQGSAADILKLAMLKLARAGRRRVRGWCSPCTTSWSSRCPTRRSRRRRRASGTRWRSVYALRRPAAGRGRARQELERRALRPPRGVVKKAGFSGP